MPLDKTSQFVNSCTPWMLDPPYTVCEDVQWQCDLNTGCKAQTFLHAYTYSLSMTPGSMDLSSSCDSIISLNAGPSTKMWSVPKFLQNLWISSECLDIPHGCIRDAAVAKDILRLLCHGSWSANASSVSAEFGSPRDCYTDRHDRSWRMSTMFEGDKSCNCHKTRRSWCLLV